MGMNYYLLNMIICPYCHKNTHKTVLERYDEDDHLILYVICQHCGDYIDLNKTFCTLCKKPLSEEEINQGYWACQTCRKEVETHESNIRMKKVVINHQKVCPNCGEFFDPVLATCPYCKTEGIVETNIIKVYTIDMVLDEIDNLHFLIANSKDKRLDRIYKLLSTILVLK
jgi:uncharacterized OB-fold protein